MSTWNSQYAPYAQQQHLHEALAQSKLFLAGLGSGKTLAGLHEFYRACQINHMCDGMIVAPTFPMLRDVIRPLWEDWLPRRAGKWIGTDYIRLASGRRVFLRTATHWDRIRGPNIGHMWFDEPAMVRSSMPWKMAIARVRDPRAKYYLRLATSTPRGYDWLIKTFSTGGHGYHITHAKTSDNIYLPDGYEAGLRAEYGSVFAAQELDAKIVESQGLTWPIYGRVHLKLSLEEMCRRSHKFFGAVDWGFTNPAALLIGGIDYDGRWYFVDCWKMRGQRRRQIAKRAAKMAEKWGVKRWYADHDPEGVDEFKRQKLSVRLAEKNVQSGVDHFGSLLAVRQDGQPRVYIFSGMRDWLKEQESYHYPVVEEGIAKDKYEEPVGENGDHLMDTSRYLTYTHDVFGNVDNSYKTVEKPRMEKEERDWRNY